MQEFQPNLLSIQFFSLQKFDLSKSKRRFWTTLYQIRLYSPPFTIGRRDGSARTSLQGFQASEKGVVNPDLVLTVKYIDRNLCLDISPVPFVADKWQKCLKTL